MLKRTPIWALVALSLAACAPTAATPKRPPISTTTLQARPVAYVRATALTAWPAGSTRRELIISGGWQPDERYAWFIADGKEVVAVYRTTTKEDLEEIARKFVQDMVFTTVSNPLDKTSWGIAGAIKIPPPPEPEPGGMPPWYVDKVMTTAWRLDAQVLEPQQIEPIQAPTTGAGGTVSQPQP